MVDYWHYRSVLYWSNVVRGKQTFCLDSRFFSTAGTVVGRDELVRIVKERIPAETLHELQTLSEVYKHRLDFNESEEKILLSLWNASPAREAVREILLERAQIWLEGARGEGVGQGPVPWPGAAVEAALCVDHGVLFPPSPCVGPEEKRAFLVLAAGNEVGDEGVAGCPFEVMSKRTASEWVSTAAMMVCQCAKAISHEKAKEA